MGPQAPNRIPYRIDRRLPGLAGPEYHAIISFGLPFEPEDCPYGKYRPIDLWPLPIGAKVRIEPYTNDIMWVGTDYISWSGWLVYSETRRVGKNGKRHGLGQRRICLE